MPSLKANGVDHAKTNKNPFGGFFLSFYMTFEEASDMYAMYSISPELTCQCDEFHMCQQCYEDGKNESDLNALENSTFEGD